MPPRQVTYDRLSRQQVLLLLRQHLTANLVRLRRRWCRQSRGIAQGSTLSTLLCRWGPGAGRGKGRAKCQAGVGWIARQQQCSADGACGGDGAGGAGLDVQQPASAA